MDIFYINIFYITVTFLTLLAMLADPAAALDAARAALAGWWGNVLPALLPFFIISDILSGCGLIRAFGVWLTPLMQPLFRLPGAAAVALLLGFFAGAPTGAAVTASLRAQGLITRNQGERMLAFCNNTSPLYLLITASSLLGSPTAGLLLAAVQYPINLAFGLALRFFAARDAASKAADTAQSYASPLALWLAGWQELAATPTPPLGQLLKSAAGRALSTIGMIGAFMLIFNLLIMALAHFGLNSLITAALCPVASLLGLPKGALSALSNGLFEMTLGLQSLSQSSLALYDRVLAAAAILGWAGFSIHVQIAGVCSHTDLTLRYYLPCRALHALLATLILRAASGYVSINSSTLPATGYPLWLALPGAMLAPVVLLLIILLLLAFLPALGQSLFHTPHR